jgi:hypothetical protein
MSWKEFTNTKRYGYDWVILLGFCASVILGSLWAFQAWYSATKANEEAWESFRRGNSCSLIIVTKTSETWTCNGVQYER